MPKRVLQVVVSDKNDKTIVVEVERRYTHPLFKKTVRRTKKYHAHDEANAFKIGDRVEIAESAPISRRTSVGLPWPRRDAKRGRRWDSRRNGR